MRRVFDGGCALIILLLATPVIIIAAIAIKCSSTGPILYRARRAGLDGAEFTMYKLRTMHLGSEAAGRITASADPRTFPAGRLIRRLKVDELPQLVNVLRGEMALVGPRPEDIDIVREHYTPLMWESLIVPPGMTSAGSLHYFADESQLPTDPAEAQELYLDSLLPAKIAVDLQYVRNPTFGYELQILARTLLAVLGLDRAFTASHSREELAAREILGGVGAA